MTVLSPSAGSQSACSLGLILVNPRRPLRSLSILFGLWKALIFLVIVICPGLGYDTSTSLLLYPTRDLSDVDPLHFPLSLRFVRWDSIYFVHAAEHGYVFRTRMGLWIWLYQASGPPGVRYLQQYSPRLIDVRLAQMLMLSIQYSHDQPA